MLQGIRNLLRPRRIWRGIVHRVSTRALILMYHRICDDPSDPCLLNVSTQRFDEHLRAIKQFGRPMPLREVVRSLRAGRMPSRAVCLTFDDGYVDNLLAAKPLLERHGVPATVFATTGPNGRRHEFWWDQIEGIFLRPGNLPRQLELKYDGRMLQMDLGNAAVFHESEAHRTKEWNLMHTEVPTARHEVFRAVHQLIQPMEDALRKEVLKDLRHWAGFDETLVRPARRALELDEMRELERGGLIEVGAHTVNHPQLSNAAPIVALQEITESKRHLEQHLGHSVTGFAYPYGLYSPLAVEMVRSAGFEYACSCIHSPVRHDSQLHLLPRLEALNWSGHEFAAKMRKWLGWT
jgi:peptidoglycan/xylan/chitin deacetylase (PgdA/CDA1 family)